MLAGLRATVRAGRHGPTVLKAWLAKRQQRGRMRRRGESLPPGIRGAWQILVFRYKFGGKERAMAGADRRVPGHGTGCSPRAPPELRAGIDPIEARKARLQNTIHTSNGLMAFETWVITGTAG